MNTETKIIVALVVFQLFHWFDPSEPFFFDYVLDHYNVTPDFVITQVYAWDVLFQLGTGLVVSLLFVLLDYRWALVTCAISAIFSTGIVLWTNSKAALIMSQFVWAYGFSAIFIVLAVFFVLLPKPQYQVAASANSLGSLVANAVASLTGFIITKKTPQDSLRTGTFYAALVSSCVSFGCLLFSLAAGWLPRSTEHSSAYALQAKLTLRAYLRETWQNLQHAEYTVYLLLAGGLRGVHTEIMTLWPNLSLNIDSSTTAQDFNGLISFFMATFACVLVLLPCRFDTQIRQTGHWFALVSMVLASCLVIAASFASSMASLAVALTFYYGFAELFLAVAAARVARSISTPASDPTYVAQYLSVMAFRYLIALITQSIIQLTIFTRWGSVHNIFGLSLSATEQFRAMAYLLLLVSSLALWLCLRPLIRPAGGYQRLNNINAPV